MHAATIAQERAHAHSRSMCWHAVKEALLASGVIDSRPKSEFARDAAKDLVRNYGFQKLSVRDPFAAAIGSVLVYGTNRSVGHVEIRTKDGFVSDFRSPTPSHRPLFFFQAEDGIRYHCVTGVQTCALPISGQLSPRFAVQLSWPAGVYLRISSRTSGA